MKRILGVTLVLSFALGLSSCAGVTCAFVSGPLTGGTSLTARVYNTEASEAVKILSTPFAFIAGTFTGWFPAFYHGVRYDVQNFPLRPHGPKPPRNGTQLNQVWDPFMGYLWTGPDEDESTDGGSK